MRNVLLILSIICCTHLFSQEFNKIKKMVDRGHYQTALKDVEKELVDNPDNIELHFYAGVCKLKLYMQEASLAHFQQSAASVDPRYYYYLSIAWMESDNPYEAKIAWAKQDPNILSEEETAIHDGNLKVFEELKASPKGVVVRNLGEVINSEGHEYNGVMTQDQKSVIYTVRKEGLDALATDGMAYEQMYRTSLDPTGKWNTPRQFGGHSSRRQHDATVLIFGDDTRMITYHGGDLYLSEQVDGKWEETGGLDMINTEEGDETHCFVNESFDTIVYATNFYSENGDLDMFMTTKDTEGEWREPEALEGLNTPYNDDAPFMGRNGDLYFSSKGHNSIGGYDIFRSRLDPATNRWSLPENLGYPINSPSDDIYYNTFGKIAYLSSGRKGGLGNMDIYRVFLFDKIKIIGQVVDESTGKVLAGAKISVREFDNQYEAYSDSLGRYEILVPIEQAFDMSISYEEQLIYNEKHQVKIFFKDQNDNVVHFKVNLENQDYSEDIPEAQIEEYVTDAREISVKMVNDYTTDPLKLAPGKDAQNEIITLEVLKPKEPKETESITANFPVIYFDFNSADLKPIAIEQLKKCLASLKGKNLKLEVIGYTDLVGSDQYNKRLGRARALAVQNYLHDNGLMTHQLSVASFGKNNPVETSPEKQHLNRRVELRLNGSGR